MFNSTTAANAAQATPFTSFKASLKTITLLLLATCAITHFSFASSLPEIMEFEEFAPQSTEEASYLLESALSSSGYIPFQLTITSEEGFENCTGEVLLSSDRRTVTFILDNPSGNPLPANTDIATLQVIDPDVPSQTNLLVTTDTGGVMIIISDF